MSKRWLLLGMTLLTGILVLVLNQSRFDEYQAEQHRDYADFDFLILTDSLDVKLLRSVAAEYIGDAASDSLIQAVSTEQQRVFQNQSTRYQALDFDYLRGLAYRMLVFSLIYFGLIALLYLTLKMHALIRFFAGEFPSLFDRLPSSLRAPARAIIRGLMMILLFTPSFIVVYLLRPYGLQDSEFSFWVIVLLTNGIFIAFSDRFTTIIHREAHAGYVDAARTRNLNTALPPGIIAVAMHMLTGRWPTHRDLFQRIWINVRPRMLTALTELTGILISSIVITELAMNFQQRLSYDILTRLLYGQIDLALIGIWWLFIMYHLSHGIIHRYARF